ncbi:hypothetical protein OQH13_04655, partial [Acinetobacter baumannii]|nr:hypothetical protein [Acinetobacter baumannii]
VRWLNLNKKVSDKPGTVQGRHPISSAYFWYVNSPLGGAFEYYTNDDYLTEEWQPRVEEHRLELFTEWAIEGGLDDKTRRQVKPV